VNQTDHLRESDGAERYEGLARKALSVYRLEEAELRLLSFGMNVVFRVQTDDGRWALRICSPDRDRKALLRELLWLVALNRDTSLDVPEPLIARDGELLRTVSMPGLSGFHPCMLFRWVKGYVEEEPTLDHLRSVGRLTATLHDHAQSFHWPDELAQEGIMSDSLLGRSSMEALRHHLRPEEREILRATVPSIQRAVDSLGVGRDVAGVVHGALDRDHYVFQGSEARAIGFGFAHRNYYAFDVATTFDDLRGRPDFNELISAYVDGYKEIRPLPCDLDEHLPAFSMLRAHARIEQILATPRIRAWEHPDELIQAAVTTAKRWLHDS
jgi:Ser/Thr protein kinase RdoA (MazF antagonist)